MLSRLKIRSKILLLVGVLSILVGFMAFIGIQTMSVNSELSDRSQTAFQSALYAEKTNGLIFATVMDSRGVYMSADPAVSKKYGQSIIASLAAMKQTQDAWRQVVPADELMRFDEMSKDVENFIKFRTHLVELNDTQGYAAAREYGDNDANRSNRQSLGKRVDELVKFYNAQAESHSAAQNAFFHERFRLLLLIAGLTVLISLSFGFFIATRSIATPLTAVTRAMRQLAGGDTSVDIASSERKDEIGEIAQAVLVFKKSMIEADHLRGEQEKERARAEQEKNQALQGMADRIEQETQRVVETIARQSGEMAGHASGMSRSADTVSANSQSVATAATQAQANVNAVASASEELSASIHEIATQVAASRNATNEAVAASSDAERTIGELTSAVAQIGAVTQLITDIAAQTNLLALNATIEAARAGEAGKGFAVVAGEVKSLASQTAKATEEITGQINSIQAVTDEAVRSVKAIASSVRSVEGLATAISAAIEEQSATTSEIARNVGETSSAAQEVAARIVDVSQEAESTGKLASDISKISATVAESVEDLKTVLIRVVRTSTKEVERRRKPRFPIHRVAQVSAGGNRYDMTVQNCSEGGALLKGADCPLRAKDILTLQLQGLPAISGRVLSQTKAGLHVKFDDTPEAMAAFAASFKRSVDGVTALKEAA